MARPAKPGVRKKLSDSVMRDTTSAPTSMRRSANHISQIFAAKQARPFPRKSCACSRTSASNRFQAQSLLMKR